MLSFVIIIMKIINITNYESFNELYRQYQHKDAKEDLKNLILLFVASDDPQTRQSWCSDCKNSKPTIDQVVEKFQFNEQLILAIVEVGSRDEWKKDDNPFRLHDLRVTAVPTLLSKKNVSKQVIVLNQILL